MSILKKKKKVTVINAAKKKKKNVNICVSVESGIFYLREF